MCLSFSATDKSQTDKLQEITDDDGSWVEVW